MALGIHPVHHTSPDRDSVSSIQENVEILQGLRGDPLNRALTVGDLLDSSAVDTALLLAKVTTTKNQAATFGYQLEKLNFNPVPLYAPTNLVITPGFGSLFLSWDGSGQAQYAHTEIWRAATSDISVAVKIGTAVAEAYVDYIGADNTYYYWVRFTSTFGVNSPYNSTNGTSGTTAPAGPFLKAQLAGEITESELNATLNSRLNLIDGANTLPGSVAQQVLDEATLRISSDAALSGSLTTLQSTVSGQGTTQLSISASVSALQGQYTVKLDANGSVAGFGLANTGTAASPSSAFQVAATKFVITDPSSPDIVPFIVSNGSVFMDTAYIDILQVSNALVATKISADAISAGTISAAVNLTAATINGGAINIPAGGTPRFSVDSQGSVKINSGTTSSTLTIDNNVLKVFDEAGTKRVQIGDLTA